MERKICEQCGVEKTIDLFRKVTNQYTGIHPMSICKDCYNSNAEECKRRQEAEWKAREAKKRAEAEARKQAEQRRESRARELSSQGSQSEMNTIVNSQRGWIYARRKDEGYPEDTERSGKWMIFAQTSEVDRVWSIVKSAVEAGELGDAAKVWPMEGEKHEHVICMYTYDSDDKRDLLRILTVLRSRGIEHSVKYKEDRETHAGNYAGQAFIFNQERRQETNRSPVKWYAREGKIELLVPRHYTPFQPEWLEENEND